jgi:hypothetical protein
MIIAFSCPFSRKSPQVIIFASFSMPNFTWAKRTVAKWLHAQTRDANRLMSHKIIHFAFEKRKKERIFTVNAVMIHVFVGFSKY